MRVTQFWYLWLFLVIFFVTAYNSKGWIKGTDRRESTDNITSLQIGLWKTCFYDNVKQQDICQRTEDFLLEGNSLIIICKLQLGYFNAMQEIWTICAEFHK